MVFGFIFYFYISLYSYIAINSNIVTMIENLTYISFNTMTPRTAYLLKNVVKLL